jgi:hypothetical protein
MGGYDLLAIPDIETPQQRLALALHREALSSNKTWLAFLLFWQVLEVGGNGDPVGWINKMHRREVIPVGKDDLAYLGLRGRSLGQYLLDDCRDAIAHIRRKPGRRALEVDTLGDYTRMLVSTGLISRFATHHVKEVLGLKKQLWLVRVGGKGFPVFRSEESTRRRYHALAYPPLHWKPGRRRARTTSAAV